MGHLSIVLLLLQNGASPDIRNIVSDRFYMKEYRKCDVIYSQNLGSTSMLFAVLKQPLNAQNCCVLTPAWGDGTPHGSTRRSDGGGSLFAEEWSVSGRHGPGPSAVVVFLVFFILFPQISPFFSDA